ncbi:MAG TPA: hypothetical protein VFF28_04325 [Candidatus Nanoarchaeia archaeon]|nr:hypothetical protein [Candidatus Nanoarchaeia archaeon]
MMRQSIAGSISLASGLVSVLLIIIPFIAGWHFVGQRQDAIISILFGINGFIFCKVGAWGSRYMRPALYLVLSGLMLGVVNSIFILFI